MYNSVPGAVEDLIIQSKTESKVVFQWIPPASPNGIILQYHISYGTLSSNLTFNTTVRSNARTFNVRALSKYENAALFSFSITCYVQLPPRKPTSLFMLYIALFPMLVSAINVSRTIVA